jgi:hypothetical protein
VNALLLQRPDNALHHPILLRAMRRDKRKHARKRPVCPM